MTDNELLLAFSDMLDKKLDARLVPIENRLKRIEVDLLENNVLPRLNTIENCYTETYNHYKDKVDQMQAVFDDVDLLKKWWRNIQENCKRFHKIQKEQNTKQWKGWGAILFLLWFVSLLRVQSVRKINRLHSGWSKM